MKSIPRDFARRPFWAKVNRKGPIMPNMQTRCWVWTGNTNYNGYGLHTAGGKTVGAHRISLMLKVGPIGDLWALHKCNNPPCVRPDHLYAGTVRDNSDDRIASVPRYSAAEVRPVIIGMLRREEVLTDGLGERVPAVGALTALANRIGVTRAAVSKAWCKGATVRQMDDWIEELALAEEEACGIPA
jgi:hypothetical protein